MIKDCFLRLQQNCDIGVCTVIRNLLSTDYTLCNIKQRFSEHQGNKAITDILTRCSSPPQDNNND